MHHAAQNTASLSDAAFAVIRSVVGPAALYLPHGVATAGLSGAACITIFSYLLFVAGTARLISCWRWHLRHYPVHERHLMAGYSRIARDLAGKNAEFVVIFGVVSLQLGVCVTYFIFVSSNMQSVIQLVVGGPKVHLTYLIFGMTLLELPLCCIRDIRRLAPTNRVANVLVGFSLILIIVYSSVHLAREGVAKEVEPGIVRKWDCLLFVGTCLFAFEGAATLTIPVGNSLEAMDHKNYFAVYLWTVLCIALVYFAFSSVCYLSYGPDVAVIITLSLDDNLFPGATIRMIYSIAVVLSFPLQLYPVLEEVSRGLQRYFSRRGDEDAAESLANGNGWRCALVVSIAAVAVVGEDSLDHIVALLGAMSSAPIALIIPPLMHRTVLARSTVSIVDEHTPMDGNYTIDSPIQTASLQGANVVSIDNDLLSRAEQSEGTTSPFRSPPKNQECRHFITPWDHHVAAAKALDIAMGSLGVLVTLLTTIMTLATWNGASS